METVLYNKNGWFWTQPIWVQISSSWCMRPSEKFDKPLILTTHIAYLSYILFKVIYAKDIF